MISIIGNDLVSMQGSVPFKAFASRFSVFIKTEANAGVLLSLNPLSCKGDNW